jgi:hypothetical protein
VLAIVWWNNAGQVGYYRADTTDPDFADTWGEDVWPLTVGLAAAAE